MPIEPNRKSGGPYDRGGADAYYGRRFNPHWWDGTTRKTIEPETEPESYAAYYAGYWDTFEHGDRKDWGEISDDQD